MKTNMRLYDTNKKLIKYVSPSMTPLFGNGAGLVMYFCGPTVYDRIHIGNFRSFLSADLLFRLLKKHQSDDTIFIRNITDIDDKIITKMKEENKDFESFITEKINLFHKDIEDMNLLRPTIEPRATEYMLSIIVLIGKLINNSHAYISNGSVYFDTKSLSDHEKIFKRSTDETSVSRIEENTDKKHKDDFVLWKKENDGPIWDSPWGKGRPGWHTECAAMISNITSSKYPISIHGGGIDLQFPHHANEHAQYYAAYNNNLSDIWMHTNMLTIDGKKMSKSSGKKIYISDLLEKYHPDVIKYYFFSTKYSNEFDFSFEKLEEYSVKFKKIYNKLKDINFSVSEEIKMHNNEEYSKGIDILFNDLNTSKFLSYIDLLNSSDLEDNYKVIYYLLKTIGMSLQGDYDKNILISNDDVNELIKKREEYRNNKQWKESDEIRDYLLSKDIIINDSGTETLWSRK